MRCCILEFAVRERTETFHRASFIPRHAADNLAGNQYRSKDKNKSHGPKNRRPGRASLDDTRVCGHLTLVRLHVYLRRTLINKFMESRVAGKWLSLPDWRID